MKTLISILILLIASVCYAGVDASGGKVVNVGTPTDPTDGVNIAFLQNLDINSIDVNFIDGPTSFNGTLTVTDNLVLGTAAGTISGMEINKSVAVATGLGVLITNTSEATHSFSKVEMQADNSTVISKFESDGLGTGALGEPGTVLGAFSNHPLGLFANSIEGIRLQDRVLAGGGTGIIDVNILAGDLTVDVGDIDVLAGNMTLTDDNTDAFGEFLQITNNSTSTRSNAGIRLHGDGDTVRTWLYSSGIADGFLTNPGGFVGTGSNHPFWIFFNNTGVLEFSASGADFQGNDLIGVGNITGSDIDVSAGTGTYTTSGLVTTGNFLATLTGNAGDRFNVDGTTNPITPTSNAAIQQATFRHKYIGDFDEITYPILAQGVAMSVTNDMNFVGKSSSPFVYGLAMSMDWAGDWTRVNLAGASSKSTGITGVFATKATGEFKIERAARTHQFDLIGICATSENDATWTQTAGTLIGRIIAGDFSIDDSSPTVSGTVDLRYIGLLVDGSVPTNAIGDGDTVSIGAEFTAGGGDDNQGLLVTAISYAGSGENVGFEVQDISGASAGNFAIRTGTGQNEIGGDLYFVNDGSGLFYGNMDQDAGTFDVNLTTQNVWVELDAATTNISAGPLNNIIFPDDHFLKINTAGVYVIAYSLIPMVDSVAGGDQHVEFQIFKNSSTTGKGETHVTFKNVLRELPVGSGTMLDLAVNDEISIGGRNTSSAGKVITIDHLEMSMNMVGGT